MSEQAPFESTAHSRKSARKSRAFAALCLCATATCVLVLVLLAIFGADPQRPLEIASVALPHATSTALCSLLIFPLAQRIHQGAALSRAFEGLGR